MKFQDRWYQTDCVDALYADIKAQNCHPIAAVPTGAGKSVILCKLIDKYLTDHPEKDVIVLSHVSEILEQNYSKLENYFDSDLFLGLYSASLGVREKAKITVAGIQSVHRKAEEFKNCGLVVIDECQLINSKDTGMYRKFLSQIDAVYCGLTATPFRTGQGYIYKDYSDIKGRNIKTIFDKLSYDLTSYENYNRLVEEGYLVNLVPAPTDYRMSVEGIHKVAGEYSEKELAERYDRNEITEVICNNIISMAGSKYKKWLLFAIDINHANNIADYLNSQGTPTASVHSKMEGQKPEILQAFREGHLKCLVNVNMLTTGLDIPSIDLVAHLRATNSPIYHIQTNGRGARPCPEIGKTHCLVLDFAGNTVRHGPINDVNITEPTHKGVAKNNSPNSKFCGNCGTVNSLRATVCVACGDEFEINHHLNSESYSGEIVKTKKQLLKEWCKVKDVSYSVHQKKGSPSSLRVMYHCGFQTFSEWVTIGHSGFHKARAMKWIRRRWESDEQMPTTLNDLIKSTEKLREPAEIMVDLSGKYAHIVDHLFDDKIKRKEKIDIFENDFPKENLAFDDDIPF